MSSEAEDNAEVVSDVAVEEELPEPESPHVHENGDNEMTTVEIKDEVDVTGHHEVGAAMSAADHDSNATPSSTVSPTEDVKVESSANPPDSDASPEVQKPPPQRGPRPPPPPLTTDMKEQSQGRAVNLAELDRSTILQEIMQYFADAESVRGFEHVVTALAKDWFAYQSQKWEEMKNTTQQAQYDVPLFNVKLEMDLPPPVLRLATVATIINDTTSDLLLTQQPAGSVLFPKGRSSYTAGCGQMTQSWYADGLGQVQAFLKDQQPDMSGYAGSLSSGGVECLADLARLEKEQLEHFGILPQHRSLMHQAILNLRETKPFLLAPRESDDSKHSSLMDDRDAEEQKQAEEAQRLYVPGAIGAILMESDDSIQTNLFTVTRLNSSDRTWSAAAGYKITCIAIQRAGHIPRYLIRLVDAEPPQLRVHTYENQRWFPFKGWTPKLLPSDRPPWSNADGSKSLPLSSFEAPPSTEWLGNWTIDRSMGISKQDGEGWSYALDFSSQTWSLMDTHTVVRRRMWYRKLQPVQNSERPVGGVIEPAALTREEAREKVALLNKHIPLFDSVSSIAELASNIAALAAEWNDSWEKRTAARENAKVVPGQRPPPPEPAAVVVSFVNASSQDLHLTHLPAKTQLLPPGRAVIKAGGRGMADLWAEYQGGNSGNEEADEKKAAPSFSQESVGAMLLSIADWFSADLFSASGLYSVDNKKPALTALGRVAITCIALPGNRQTKSYIILLSDVREPPLSVHTWENQRWYPFKGWTDMLLPTDRPSWSDEDGIRETPRNQFIPPLNTQWSSDWHLTTPGSVPPDCWVYAIGFSSKLWYHENDPASVVRRRRWTRNLQRVEAPLSAESLPLR